MKTEDKVMESLIAFSVDMKISESKVLDIADEYHLGVLQYSKLCESLFMQGYDIVSEEEYQKAVEIAKANQKAEILPLEEIENTSSEQPTKYDDIILKFRELELSDKQECFIKLKAILATEDEKSKSLTVNPFMDKIRNMKLQYSYVSVLLKAFFSECNEMGKVDLNALIIYFDNYYRGRQKQGLVSEQSDSVLGKSDFSDEDIRRIILFNPLKRSFLSNYFVYHKKENVVCMDESLWSALSTSEKQEIPDICDKKLDVYYERIGGAVPKKQYKLIGKDGKMYLSDTKGTLGGHRQLKIYGRLDCPSALKYIEKGMYVKHRVFFADEETAIAAGYRPCSVCMKEQYKAWKAKKDGK